MAATVTVALRPGQPDGGARRRHNAPVPAQEVNSRYNPNQINGLSAQPTLL